MLPFFIESHRVLRNEYIARGHLTFSKVPFSPRLISEKGYVVFVRPLLATAVITDSWLYMELKFSWLYRRLTKVRGYQSEWLNSRKPNSTHCINSGHSESRKALLAWHCIDHWAPSSFCLTNKLRLHFLFGFGQGVKWEEARCGCAFSR